MEMTGGPNGERCGNCQLWDWTGKNAEDGICRRKSPVPIVIEGGKEYTAVWPLTNKDRDWCGNFKEAIIKTETVEQ